MSGWYAVWTAKAPVQDSSMAAHLSCLLYASADTVLRSATLTEKQLLPLR
jgi:hypothetical protein